MSGQPGRKGHLITITSQVFQTTSRISNDSQSVSLPVVLNVSQCFSMFSKLLKCTLRVSIMQFPELLLSVLLV